MTQIYIWNENSVQLFFHIGGVAADLPRRPPDKFQLIHRGQCCKLPDVLVVGWDSECMHLWTRKVMFLKLTVTHHDIV